MKDKSNQWELRVAENYAGGILDTMWTGASMWEKVFTEQVGFVLIVADKPETARSRILYLLSISVVWSEQGECVAVWCKTGSWSSLK